MFQYIKRSFILLASVVLLCGVTGCSEDKEELLANQGLLNFQLTRSTVYMLSSIEEISTVIVTLEKEGIKYSLPSLEMTGTPELITSTDAKLEAGTYRLHSYRTFAYDGNLLFEEEPETAITVQVEAQKTQCMVLPVAVKVVHSTNNIRNVLYALATEAIGEDRTKWPASWDENESIKTWEGLEFEFDDYGNPTALIGLIIDGDGYTDIEFNANLTPIKHGLPEFKNMKRLSGAIVNLPTLQSLIIRDCTLEELPENMNESNLSVIQIENTNLASLPASMGQMKSIKTISLINNKFTQFPEAIQNMKTLAVFDLVNEKIESIPASMTALSKLISLRIQNSLISELPDVFYNTTISTLDVRYNAALASLPASIGVEYDEVYGNQSRLHGLLLDGCAFTAIPAQAVRPGIRTLSMANNKLTQVNADEIAKMTDLQSLILDDNKFTAFPALQHPHIVMLSLVDCELERAQIDVTGLPSLSDQWLIMTPEERDALFFGNQIP